MNSLEHSSIKVENCYCLNANQAIIVYHKNKNDEFDRKIIRGPGIFALSPDEW